MAYRSVDDIILKGPNSQENKKKGKAGKLILILFILIIIFGGAAAGYWYYVTYMKESPKSSFFKYIGNNNIEELLNLDLYYNMINQMTEKSFFMETTAEFSTNKQNNFVSTVDSSKFDLNITLERDINHKKSLLDSKVSYSSNDLFDLKILDTDNSIGIISSDITDKYIASNKSKLDNSIAKTTGIETDISIDGTDDLFKAFTDSKIDIDNSYIKQKSDDYLNIVYSLIEEDSVTKKENIVVTNNSETINTDAYTLKLSAETQKEIIKSVLEKLKSDDELLNKIVSGKETVSEVGNNDDVVLEQSNSNTIAPITNIQTSTNVVEGEEEPHESEMIVDQEESEISDNLDFKVMSKPETDLVDQIEENPVSDELSKENSIINDNTVEDNQIYLDLMKAFILKIKIQGTVGELKSRLDEAIKNTDSIKDEIEITVYVRNEEAKEKETVKLFIKFADKDSVDIDYNENSKVKITYLTTEKDSEGKDFSAGNSIEIEKKSTDVNVKYIILYNQIEKAKVISKTQFELQTDNSNSSRGYTNTIIIKNNDNEGDLKINIKNEILFQTEDIEEELNEENSIFLDQLSNEEAENLYLEVFQKIMSVYEKKMKDLDFIDNNSAKALIQQPEIQKTNEEEKENIKKKIIEVVANMMYEAEQKGEVFTIQNLQNFSIEGYDVSSNVSEDLAIIRINGYVFNIDKDFNLSEQ